jgi:hypothetical protein
MKSLKNYHFYAMLIACKCTTLFKKLDCNAKSEPSNFATTLGNNFMTSEIK